MPYYIFLYNLYNLNYDNVPLKLFLGKNWKFDTKNQSHDFFEIINIFHEKSLENNKFRFLINYLKNCKNLSQYMTIYFNENIDNFTKNEKIDFLHQFSVFP